MALVLLHQLTVLRSWIRPRDLFRAAQRGRQAHAGSKAQADGLDWRSAIPGQHDSLPHWPVLGRRSVALEIGKHSGASHTGLGWHCSVHRMAVSNAAAKSVAHVAVPLSVRYHRVLLCTDQRCTGK